MTQMSFFFPPPLSDTQHFKYRGRTQLKHVKELGFTLKKKSA